MKGIKKIEKKKEIIDWLSELLVHFEKLSKDFSILVGQSLRFKGGNVLGTIT